MHRLRNMACVRGIGPYQLGLRRDRGVRLVAPTAQRLRRDPQILGDLCLWSNKRVQRHHQI